MLGCVDSSDARVAVDGPVKNVDRAVLSAFEAMKDFAGSDVGARLTPKQFLAAVSIAAVEQANRVGRPPRPSAIWRMASRNSDRRLAGVGNRLVGPPR